MRLKDIRAGIDTCNRHTGVGDRSSSYLSITELPISYDALAFIIFSSQSEEWLVTCSLTCQKSAFVSLTTKDYCRVLCAHAIFWESDGV